MLLNNSLYKYCIILLLFITSVSCSKALLDEKPSSTLVVPSTIDDMDKMLEDVNTTFCFSPEMGEISSDDYYIPDLATWQAFGRAKTRNCYLWKQQIYDGETQIPDWNIPYRQIFYCNNVLEGLEKIQPNTNNQSIVNTVKSNAYFCRAYALYNLATIFCEAYDSSISKSVKGLPLRLKADVNDNSQRSTLENTYQQIIADLQSAESIAQPVFNIKRPNRPSLVSVYALFARIYLSMRKYNLAKDYADRSLKLNSNLLQFYKLDKTSTRPFPNIPQADNIEVLYYDRFVQTNQFLPSSSRILADSILFKSYEQNDLRKVIYFSNSGNNRIRLKGGYMGTSFCFSGLAVDEMFLIRSECLAREGEIKLAMEDLNTLLKSRWDINTSTGQSLYTDKVVFDAKQALDTILSERRKELVFRGIRWSDIKRLNKEGKNINLKRVLDGTIYSLMANDKRFVLPIPDDEIMLSGIEQNVR